MSFRAERLARASISSGTNKRTVQAASATGNKKYDCFSQVCNVWAPMYRVAGLHSAAGAGTDPGTIAYNSVLSDWKDFIAHYDDGHPIIYIGHFQGSVMLIELLKAEVDPYAALRKRTVAAIIAGETSRSRPARPWIQPSSTFPLHLRSSEWLRDRLLLVPIRTTLQLHVRAARPGDQPQLGTDRHHRGPGGLCESGRDRWWHNRHVAVLPDCPSDSSSGQVSSSPSRRPSGPTFSSSTQPVAVVSRPRRLTPIRPAPGMRRTDRPR